MKMYIILKETVPAAMAPVVAAHGALACYKNFENESNMLNWMEGSFKKKGRVHSK